MKKSMLKKVLIVGGGVAIAAVAVLFGKKALSERQEPEETCYDSDGDDNSDSEE